MPFRAICSLMSEPICSVEMSCICRRLPLTYKKRGTNFLPDSRVTTPNISYKLFHAVAITAFGNFLEMLSSKKEDFVVNESQGIVTNAICRYMSFLVSLFRSFSVFRLQLCFLYRKGIKYSETQNQIGKNWKIQYDNSDCNLCKS